MIMKLKELMASESYKDARKRIDGWKKRLDEADIAEALSIDDEKRAFFSQLRRSHPEICRLLKADEKIISEIVYKRLTGMDVVLD
jgi:hypothetical protein